MNTFWGFVSYFISSTWQETSAENVGKKKDSGSPPSQQMLNLDRKTNTLIPKKVTNYEFQKFKEQKLTIFSLPLLLNIFYLMDFRQWEKARIIFKIAAINPTELSTFSFIQGGISSHRLKMLRKDRRLRFTMTYRRENITQQAIIWIT